MAKKKEKPTPLPCTCGCQPVAAKVKGRGWLVTCPAVRGCANNATSGLHPKEDQAVEAWNTAITSLLYKEAKA